MLARLLDLCILMSEHMNGNQEDKLGMYYSVETACDKHSAVWQTLPAFITAFGEFQTHVAAISDAAESQETGVTGASRSKNIVQKAVADEAYPIGTAVQTWATITGDNQLAKRVYKSMSDFNYYLRDTEVEIHARLVHTEATAHLAALADYGVTQARLDELDAAIDAYHALLVAPRTAITDRKAATAALKALFKQADTVLKTRMDKLVPILAKDHPAFVADYENARIIVDSGGK